MAFDLRSEVEELRKRGKSLGLSNDQIDQSILRSLGEEDEESLKEEKKPKQKHFRSCRLCCIAMVTTVCVLLAILATISVLSSNNKQFQLAVGRTLADWQYPITRTFRIMALPLHGLFDMSKMYAWECMVNNPGYSPAEPECDICEKALRVPTRSSERLLQQDFKTKYFDPGFSVIIANVHGYGDVNHTYEELLELCQTHKSMNKDACEFYDGGENSNVTRLEELLGSWDHYKAEGNIVGWKVCYGKGFRELRKLYPRPYFVHTEGALEKVIALLQPAGDSPATFQLPHASFDNVWLAQVAGTSAIELKPLAECEENCKPFQIKLHKGNVLFFTQQVWNLSFSNSGQEAGIIFVSSFA